VDGLSLAPLLKGARGLDRTALFWHFPHYHGSAWTPGAAIRQEDWKLIAFYETGESELYNLKTDPEERNNLIDVEPAKATALKDKLLEMQQATGAQFASKREE
jgi:arylsulfatase A-like enzyme